MRLVLDTNILIAALITRSTPPNDLYEAWRDGQFVLVVAEPLLEEFRRVTRREAVRALIQPAEAGRMMNDLRRLALVVEELPSVTASPDPHDNFLLAMAEAAQATLLVSGDRRGLLDLGVHRGTRIVTARDALGWLNK